MVPSSGIDQPAEPRRALAAAALLGQDGVAGPRAPDHRPRSGPRRRGRRRSPGRCGCSWTRCRWPGRRSAPAAARPRPARRRTRPGSRAGSALTRGARPGRGARPRGRLEVREVPDARQPQQASRRAARRPAMPRRPRRGDAVERPRSPPAPGCADARGERAQVGADARARPSRPSPAGRRRRAGRPPPPAGRPSPGRPSARPGRPRAAEVGVAAALGAAADARRCARRASGGPTSGQLDDVGRRSRGGSRIGRATHPGRDQRHPAHGRGRRAARSMATWVPSECATRRDRRQRGDQRAQRRGEGLRAVRVRARRGARARSPGRSTATARGAAAPASASGSGPQPSLKPLRPWMRSTAGPVPASSVAMARHGGTIRVGVGYPWPVSEKLELVAPRGYCAGVDRAIETVERVLEELGPPVYVRGEIVHNTHVVATPRREGRGVRGSARAEVPEGQTIILSAHGVSPEVRRVCSERDLRVIDATCPLVVQGARRGPPLRRPRRDGAARGPRWTTTR